MKPHFETETFAVFDDFLSEESIAAVRKSLEEEGFSYLKSTWKPKNSQLLIEGDPLVGPTVFHHHSTVSEGLLCYPSGKPADAVIEALLGVEDALSPWVGAKGSDWDYLTCTPYMYPAASGLSWHDDARDRSGSYILYLHDEWKSTWGAELLVAADRRASTRRYQGINTDLGHYVSASPNRLVVIKAGTPHKVNQVSPRAGENVRMSFTGFFQPLR